MKFINTLLLIILSSTFFAQSIDDIHEQNRKSIEQERKAYLKEFEHILQERSVDEYRSSLISNNNFEPCAHESYNSHAMDNQSQSRFESTMEKLVERQQFIKKEQLVTIPVVVHIIHNGEAIGTGRNISDEQVQSAIRAITDAFRRTQGTRYASMVNNAGLDYNTLASDTEIEFKLATVTPEGQSTTGINRILGPDPTYEQSGKMEDVVKPATIWNPDYYMNIWVADLFSATSGNLLGFATFPTFTGLEGLGLGNEPVRHVDGIVVNYRTFGSNEYGDQFSQSINREFGITAIHEVGHFLGLRHIWGDAISENSGCSMDDFVEDTPNAASNANKTNCDLKESCGSIDLVENYMDYGNDLCKNIFTKGQNERMQVVMSTSPRRASLTSSEVENGVSPAITIPNNDLCTAAINISCSSVITGNTTNTTNNGTITGMDNRLCAGQSASHGLWYRLVGQGETVNVSTQSTNTDYDARIHIFEGSCDNLHCAGAFDDGLRNFSGSDLAFLAEQGKNYFIYINGYRGDVGNFELTLSCTSHNTNNSPANDFYIDADVVICGQILSASSTGSSVDALIPNSCNYTKGDIGVWYKIIGTGDVITISTCATASFDTKIAVLQGSGSFINCEVSNDDAIGCENRSEKQFLSDNGQEYLIWVGGQEQGDFSLEISCSPAPEGPFNVTFLNQSQVDSFGINYGLSTEILGNILIKGDLNNPISNLEPLANLERIGGDLEIRNASLTDMTGFSKLSFVGGGISLIGNNLESLDGLESLKTIGGSFFFIQIGSSQNLDGIRNLEELGGDFILNNPFDKTLTQLPLMDKLTEVKGLKISGFDQLGEITGFNALTKVNSDFEVSFLAEMQRISGFQNLEEVGGNFNILVNESLTDLSGFKALRSCGENFELWGISANGGGLHVFAICGGLLNFD